MTRKVIDYVPYGWNSADSLNAHSYLLPAIKRFLPAQKGLTILDVGCGNGYITHQLASMGYDAVGIDVSEDGIVLARKTYPELRFEVSSAYDDLSVLMREVDIVVSSEVIEHLFRPKLFLQNSFDILSSGGVLILTTPYHGYLKNLALSLSNSWDSHHTVDWEGGHIKFFSENTLSKMLIDVGFEKPIFNNAGRVPWLWKSMVCKAEKI